MSAAWKKKVSAGKAAARRVRSSPGILERRVMLWRFSEIRISPSPLPTGGAVAERQIDTRIREPDIVENRVQFRRGNHAANLGLHAGEDVLRLFDSSAGGTPDVQPHLSGVHIGKEILADEQRPGRATSRTNAANAPPLNSAMLPAPSSSRSR